MHVCLQGTILRNHQEENLIGSVKKEGKKIKHEKSIGIRPTACSDLKENEVKLVNFSWSLLLLT